MRRGLLAFSLLVGATSAPARAQIFKSEFFAEPVSEGWESITQYCEPELWNDMGWYHQQLDLDACPPGPQGGHDSYRRSLQPLNGSSKFFAEFRVQTDGDRSEIPYGAPALLAMGNNAGVNYHITVAGDLVKFAVQLDPIWFIEIEQEVPHTYRIELHPSRWSFYIDDELIDQGTPRGPFPAYESVIAWQGSSQYLPCENAWDYIRYGVTPNDASGDFDSDAAVTLSDFYFVEECLTNQRPGINGGPEMDAGPGCRFADFDADGDVDLLDFAEFQNLFSP